MFRVSGEIPCIYEIGLMGKGCQHHILYLRIIENAQTLLIFGSVGGCLPACKNLYGSYGGELLPGAGEEDHKYYDS